MSTNSDKLILKHEEDSDVIPCPITKFELINSSIFNKGSAFTYEEREQFNLKGLLPSKTNSLEEQIERSYKQYSDLTHPLRKNDFMTSLRQQNKTLYYALVSQNLTEMIPIIYTPTEGDAIINYSNRFRRPEGCFLDITSPESIEERLEAFGLSEDLDYIVVSDGEAILGIGCQGVGGASRISLAKLGLMTLCAGIHPARGLAVALDVGTNNKDLATDPLYMGNKFSRISGEKYFEFLDKFLMVLKRKYPNVIVHFEDFGVPNAQILLDKYRDVIPCFNDDIQGTGAVVTASLMAALKFTNRDLPSSKILVYGAGTAGCGIAQQIVNHLKSFGLTEKEAYSKIYCVDRFGLIVKSLESKSNPTQMFYAKDDADFEGVDTTSLKEVINHIKPTCLIGCSTQAGAFNEEIIKTMLKHNPDPIIFPLSNPTKKSEATPNDLLKWTNNKALVATGSPFADVGEYKIAQNNNCFSFPGIGLGAVTIKATKISDGMISACVNALAELSPLSKIKKEDGQTHSVGLLPGVEEIISCSSVVAAAVALEGIKEGLATVDNLPTDFAEMKTLVERNMWKPVYKDLVKSDKEYTFQT
ncbi:hypothetical protein HANVADRAFT_51619 [Hanseniaspora valbyensis NRRL Y-1626]|uniref:Malic enzyme n=1 Tax=Hanseniaspora valbyensis NRRL Y-1626 TaxID=766949 RepID=A0A1B7THU0_9ASCO|nr:hypothetical protein HANVADRAFT_51619 [Hanseniaspora valbyensis NRRL Y-1626]